MTKRNEIYKCVICANIVKVLHNGAVLSCCEQPMNLIKENTTDASVEKHVPKVESIKEGYKVTVGEVEHPMTAEHNIEWIQLIVGDEVCTKYLKPGELPVATFKTDAKQVIARAYCNLHGLWKK